MTNKQLDDALRTRYPGREWVILERPPTGRLKRSDEKTTECSVCKKQVLWFRVNELDQNYCEDCIN